MTTLETRDYKRVLNIILNDYEEVDRHIFFKLTDGSMTRGHNVVLVKEWRR